MLLDDSPMIAAVRGEHDLCRALSAKISLIFYLNASVLILADRLSSFKKEFLVTHADIVCPSYILSDGGGLLCMLKSLPNMEESKS